MTNNQWDTELANFLTDLSAVQDATLEILTKKRECIVAKDLEGLAAIGQEEQRVVRQLEQCLERREGLLRRASDEGLPSDSIESLTAALPGPQRADLRARVRQSAGRARLLRHHSLTNWVLVQRTLLHLAQMVEIIATGGRMKPTYGKDEPVHAGGTLVDHAV
ncbi:MAG: flagellar protein FlgN [Pirellulales bacterium]|nr:flagellar protein FlgN [Pirellulales bacterium]